ncbi:hypothetical protein BY996DRAFT_6409824 [Phakopsora pachyrhizi]|nr:hypothetical protein BY996DRAFT_6409824 [Phakopsora pachyrhizi]
MFRAVFESAVERAEENPALVDSEDVPLALLCHIATLSYLIIILFYLPNSPDQHNPLIDTVTPDNTQAGLLGGHWQEINTTLHPPPAVAGVFYLLLGRSAVIIVGIGSQSLLIIRRIFGSHLVIIIHLLIPSEENFALEKFKWHRAGLNQTINSFLHHHHHQTATVRGSTRATGQGRGLGLSSSDAVVKATDLYSSAVLWGPDFKGWQKSKTLTKNIKNQFGSEIANVSLVLALDQAACPGLPSNCYSEEFLNGLKASHKLSLSIQKLCVQLDQHIFSITPQHILAEANVHP